MVRWRAAGPTLGSRSTGSRIVRLLDGVEACPVDAITPQDMGGPEWEHYIEKYAAYLRRE